MTTLSNVFNTKNLIGVVNDHESQIGNLFGGLLSSITWVTDPKYGADPTEVNDSSDAILNAINAAPEGTTLIIPPGRYKTTKPIVVNKLLRILAEGAVLVAYHSGDCLVFQHATASSFGVYPIRLTCNISLLKKTLNWSDSSVGIRIVNSYAGNFIFPRIAGFTTALIVQGQTLNGSSQGSSYNVFHIGRIEDHKIGVVLQDMTDTNVGWATENSFYGGSFGLATNGLNNAGSIHVWLNGSAKGNNNNNKFFGVSFEGIQETGIKGDFTINNTFHECRYEMPYAVNIASWGANSQSNRIIYGEGLADNLLTKFTDNGRYNIVECVGYNLGLVKYYDGQYFSFVKPGDNWTSPAWTTGKNPVPIGGNPVKIIQTGGGSFTIDLVQGRYFDLIADAAITSISIVNIPLNFKGMRFTVRINQNSAAGYAIGGFPANWKFGSKTAAPVTRVWGMDLYELLYDGTNFLVMQQYAS